MKISRRDFNVQYAKILIVRIFICCILRNDHVMQQPNFFIVFNQIINMLLYKRLLTNKQTKMITKHLKGFVILIVILSGCNAENKVQQELSAANNPVYSDEIEARIERIISNLQVNTDIENEYIGMTLSERMEYYNTPGVSVAVINNGEIEWARGFGKSDLLNNEQVDINTLFQAASISKPIFALTVMRLKERGLVNLDRDINEYLESWKVPKNDDWQPKVSLRQLLSHTAGMTVHGFKGYTKTDEIPTVPQILNGEHPANSNKVRVAALPGKGFKYSGGGYTVAQLAIEDILSKPLSLIMEEELFRPLGLKYSTYQQPLPESLSNITSIAYPYFANEAIGGNNIYPESAAAGLWTNPTELATILIEVQKAVKGKSSQFKKETIDEMLSPQKAADFMGIGFFLGSEGDSLRFGHSGWNKGFVSQATAYKNIEYGAVIMVNSNEGNSLLREIMRAIAVEYEYPDFTSMPAVYIETDMDEVRSYIGIYADSDNNELVIKVSNDKVFLSYENQDPIELFKTESGEFRNRNLNMNIRFENDKLILTQYQNSTVYLKQ